MKLKRAHIVTIVILGTSIFSFMIGMIFEATRHHYDIYECRQKLRETKQELSIYQTELSHLRSESSKDNYGDISTMNWTDALNE